MNTQHCPCGTRKTYGDCCLKAHQSPAFIATAEELMCSRYTAYTMALGAYLVETHHSETKHEVDEHDLADWAKSVKWERLDVLSKTKGEATDTNGTVEFKAYFKEKNKRRVIHENSYFEKEYGSWKYKGYA